MKKILYTLALICASSPLLAQDFSLFYEPSGETDFIVVRDLSTLEDGNLLAGYDLMSGGMPTAGIMKIDHDGAVLWSKTLEIPVSLAGCTFEVVKNGAGNYYLWGLSKEEGTNNMRAILSEISSDGEMLWSKEYDFGYNATTSYTVNKLFILPSGDLQMMIAVYDEVIVLKTNASGEMIWGRRSAMGPPDEGGKNPGFEWLAVPGDGGMCASKAENDFSLLRYSEEGELMWNKTYSIGGYTHGKTIARSPNGNILIAGFVDYVPHIMELSDEDGSINWVKTFVGGGAMGLLSKSHLTVMGESIILDYTTNANVQYILELDAGGEVTNTMVGSELVFDYNKIEVASESEIYYYGASLVGSNHYGMIHRTGDLMTESCKIVAGDPITTIDYAGVVNEEVFDPFTADFTDESPIEIVLNDLQLKVRYACDVYLSTEMEEESILSIYPNPAGNLITIQMDETLVNTNYTITDLSGKEVLTGRVQTAQETIDISNLSNGQYIFAIQTENGVYTEKIAVLK